MKLRKIVSDKKWFILASALMLAAVFLLTTYLGLSQKPIDSISISPSQHADVWSFTLEDGTPVVPDENGLMMLPDSASVLHCTTSLARYPSMTSSALLAVNSRACAVVLFADGKLLADPSRCFDEASGTFSEPALSGSGGGLFTLGKASTLTLLVQFPTREVSLPMLPTITVYPELYAYQSVHLTQGARAALPAGVFFTMAMALALLFLLRLYAGKADADVLLLSIAALSFCLLNTLTYGVYMVWLLQTPYLTYALRLLPTLVLLWALWFRWNSMLHRFGWLLPLLCTLAVTVGMVWKLLDPISGNQYTNLLQGTLLPCAMLIALLLCAWQAIAGSRTLRRFFCMSGVLAALLGLAAWISFLSDGHWFQTLRDAVQHTALLGFFEPLQLFNQFLLIILFLLAFYDFVMHIAHRNAELQALTLQNRYALENAEHLRQSLDEARTLRHEVRHHLHALQALCAEGNLNRIQDYVNTLGSSFTADPILYSDHALINALITAGSLRAHASGIDFSASLHVPESFDILDADLAVLLSNMIDNALEAAAAVPDRKDRRINLKISVYEDAALFVSCSNTFFGNRNQDASGDFLSTKEGDGHGLGLKAMKRVVQTYNGLWDVQVNDNTFHVKTYLKFKAR